MTIYVYTIKTRIQETKSKQAEKVKKTRWLQRWNLMIVKKKNIEKKLVELFWLVKKKKKLKSRETNTHPQTNTLTHIHKKWKTANSPPSGGWWLVRRFSPPVWINMVAEMRRDARTKATCGHVDKTNV